MRGDEDEQGKLPMDLPDPERRRRRRKPGRKPRPAEEPQALMEAPVIQTCGFCGNRQTLLGEAGICEECGGILVRDDESMG